MDISKTEIDEMNVHSNTENNRHWESTGVYALFLLILLQSWFLLQTVPDLQLSHIVLQCKYMFYVYLSGLKKRIQFRRQNSKE